jgi:hypothetical protein
MPPCFEQTVLLNDFGSAAAKGKLTLFEGALENAPEAARNAFATGTQYCPEPEHDLEMVVCSIFQRACPVAFAQLLTLGAETPANRVKCIARFWKQHASGEPWCGMFDAARALEYATLKQLIQGLCLPSSKTHKKAPEQDTKKTAPEKHHRDNTPASTTKRKGSSAATGKTQKKAPKKDTKKTAPEERRDNTPASKKRKGSPAATDKKPQKKYIKPAPPKKPAGTKRKRHL